MIAAVALTLLSIGCVVAAWRLPSARWTSRAPRTAILLWQSIGLTWGLATTGALLAYALQPYGQGVIYGLHSHLSSVLTLGLDPESTFTYDLSRTITLVAGLALLAVLIGVLLAALWQTLRARHRHRRLLALVAREDPHVPGVRILDHPGATAYCVPGLRSEVVVSAGALRLLSRDELAAVLAHEDAHVRERHDLVLLPFAALRRAIPWSRIVRDAQSSVALLVEMAADDRARRHCSPRRLATALLRFGAAGSMPAPQGALGAVGHVMARVNRLIAPAAELPRPFRYGVVALSALLTASAPLLWAMPH